MNAPTNPNELLNDPQTVMEAALRGWQAGIWTALPAIVLSVDFEKMTCTARPAITGIQNTPTGQIQTPPMPILLDVPIVFPRVSGFALTLPLAIGDEILVIFSSRCIDGWWQSGCPINSKNDINPALPLEFRMHDLSDGFAIPGPCSIPKVLPNVSSTDAQLRSEDGNTYISITPAGTVKIKATSVEVDGDISATGEITAQSGGATPIPLSTHVHTGVTSGGSNTGGPI